MIYILTGPIDSGKTSQMLEIYNNARPGNADGFISAKIYRNNYCIGYEITRLATGQKKLLALLSSAYNNEFEDKFSFGPFIFDQAGFNFGESIIKDLLINDAVEDLYIDEIGPIELEGHGFSSLLQQALESQKNLYICIRSKCLQKVLDNFGISQYKIIIHN